jgi:hypothetical protein
VTASAAAPREAVPAGQALRSYRRRLEFHRLRAWTLLAFLGLGFAVCLVAAIAHPTAILFFVIAAVVMFGIFHALPRGLERSPPSDKRVGSEGDRWRVCS